LTPARAVYKITIVNVAAGSGAEVRGGGATAAVVRYAFADLRRGQPWKRL
jgi:hypothetical protein